VAVQTATRAVSTRVTVPPDPLEVAAKVDLAPIVAIVVASWLTISPQFVPYPLTQAYEESSLRDRGLGLLLLFAAVSWARARTHRRRFAALYGFIAALLLVEFSAGGGGFGGELGAVHWNEVAVGVVALSTTVCGWKSAGRDRPDPSDRAISSGLGGDDSTRLRSRRGSVLGPSSSRRG